SSEQSSTIKTVYWIVKSALAASLSVDSCPYLKLSSVNEIGWFCLIWDQGRIKMNKVGYLVSVSGISLVLMLAPTAFAQPTPPATEDEQARDVILVTAQRRGEDIQDVAASVTALGGGQLETAAVFSTTDLTTAVPGLTFAQSS